MLLLIAPNAFKNSLNATQVAEALKKGFEQSKLACYCKCFPVADGGDGTANLLIEKLKGSVIRAEAHDALGRNINSRYGLVDEGKTAVIELADASGLKLLQPKEYNPLITTTYGTGELIKDALDKGIDKIVLGVGGSATVDGATGILRALGAKFFDAEGNVLESMESMMNVEGVDVTTLDFRILNAEVVILCDVENRLLGDQGSAKVFGPQKGAKKEDIEKLEAALSKLSDVAQKITGINMADIKHGGAAGGTAAGLHAFIKAKLVDGVTYFLDRTGFDEELEKADIVITGEGSIDTQTLHGKGPLGVAQRAKQYKKYVIGVAGKVPILKNEELQKYFDVLVPINNQPYGMSIALSNTYANLVRTASMIGDILSLKQLYYLP